MNENTFLKKFEAKPDEELKSILSNPNEHQFDAIEAASVLLDLRAKESKEVHKEASLLEEKRRNNLHKSHWNLRFDAKTFIVAYNWNVAYGHFATSFFYATIILLFQFYSGEDELIINRVWTVIITLPALLFLNNWFYYKAVEYKMTFTIRCLNDITFLSYYSIIISITSGLLYQKESYFNLNLTNFIQDAFGIIILVIIYELVIQGLIKIRNLILKTYE